MKIRIAASPTIDSIVDGPGLRTVFWLQGCLHNCKNCHNPQTHDMSKGMLVEVDELVDFYFQQSMQSGVTISGGDPFYQPEALFELVNKLKKKDKTLNIWIYTGFQYEHCIKLWYPILEKIDVLVDGLYIDELRSLSLLFRGSTNQRLIDVKQSLENNKVILYEEKE